MTAGLAALKFVFDDVFAFNYSDDTFAFDHVIKPTTYSHDHDHDLKVGLAVATNVL